MGKNNNKKKEVTNFQKHRSRMDRLEYRLTVEEKKRLAKRKARQEEEENE